jgi:hypothetical protein
VCSPFAAPRSVLPTGIACSVVTPYNAANHSIDVRVVYPEANLRVDCGKGAVYTCTGLGNGAFLFLCSLLSAEVLHSARKLRCDA